MYVCECVITCAPKLGAGRAVSRLQRRPTVRFANMYAAVFRTAASKQSRRTRAQAGVLIALPLGTLVFTLWLSVLCMRSKAWLAARVSLQLACLPRTASSVQRSRCLRSTRAAAPVLLAQAEVTENLTYLFQWVQNLGTPW